MLMITTVEVKGKGIGMPWDDVWVKWSSFFTTSLLFQLSRAKPCNSLCYTDTMDKVTAKDSAVPTASTEPSLNSGEVVNIPGEKGDIALKFIHDYGHLTYTLEEEKAVLKKIDMRLMPLMFISYMIVYMDKSILGQAAVYGIRQDLNFKGQDYSWASYVLN
jgi:hypothetical protein